jgi:oxalate decarboxylase/phosphoglucose isomerase-like protein (cupin superfamily)
MSTVTVDAVREVRFAQHLGHESDGILTVFPGNDARGVPFPIARVFTLSRVAPGGTRGHHAHRACAQLVVCLTGRAEVRVEDGLAARTVQLDSAATGVLIPPGLWNVVTFASAATVIAVFCDRAYDEGDYIRDRAEFLRAAGRP